MGTMMDNPAYRKLRTDRVYLAGGMHSGWQEIVKDYFMKNPVPGIDLIFLDPCTHGLTDETAYTIWDINAVAQSNWIFAYMEESNPSGAGMSLELGYALGLDKNIIFVDETKGTIRETFFGMHRTVASVTVETLQEGINALRELLKLSLER